MKIIFNDLDQPFKLLNPRYGREIQKKNIFHEAPYPHYVKKNLIAAYQMSARAKPHIES
jgi:hypothetical protein